MKNPPKIILLGAVRVSKLGCMLTIIIYYYDRPQRERRLLQKNLLWNNNHCVITIP